MTPERGFRRIVLVLSIVLVLAGITLDATRMVPHATVQVTLKDGRKINLERRGWKEDVTEPDSIIFHLHGVLAGLGSKEAVRNPPSHLEVASSVANVQIVRGPAYWWWADADYTFVTAMLVVVLWIMFYVLRWMVRGFIDTGGGGQRDDTTG